MSGGGGWAAVACAATVRGGEPRGALWGAWGGCGRGSGVGGSEVLIHLSPLGIGIASKYPATRLAILPW